MQPFSTNRRKKSEIFRKRYLSISFIERFCYDSSIKQTKSEANMTIKEENGSFKDLNLHPGIIRAIEECGYNTPTPIQNKAIPEILGGRDLQASAQTGTGKTAAFLLPAIQRITQPSKVNGHGPRVLILVPTRELAEQVSKEAIKYCKYLARAKTVCIYGGVPYPIQNKNLSRPHEILVATPGRLIDHLERGRIDFSRLEMLILDEADRMLDMGFIEPVEQIAAATPATRQTLMFSATLKGNVLNLSRRLLKNPQEVSVVPEKTKHECIDQRLHYVDNIAHKNRLLNHLLNDESLKHAIIFTSTKRQADELVETLIDNGHQAAALHGDMNQRQRTRTIAKMREEKIRILVATDVAARGIDIHTITHVINFDLPYDIEAYVHRIGRTGRAGATGIAHSFAGMKEVQLVKQIERFTGHPITPHEIPGFEPTTKPFSTSPSRFDSKARKRPGASQGRMGSRDKFGPKPSYKTSQPRTSTPKPSFKEGAPRQSRFKEDAPRQNHFKEDAPRQSRFKKDAPRESRFKDGGFKGKVIKEDGYKAVAKR